MLAMLNCDDMGPFSSCYLKMISQIFLLLLPFFCWFDVNPQCISCLVTMNSSGEMLKPTHPVFIVFVRIKMRYHGNEMEFQMSQLSDY